MIKIELTSTSLFIKSRSAVHFVIFIAIAVSTTIFLVSKMTEVVADIAILNDSAILVSERYSGGGWTDYTSEKFGFKISYPGDWDIVSDSNNVSLAITISDLNRKAGLVFPNFSLGIAVPTLRCDASSRDGEFVLKNAKVINGTEYFRACLNLNIGDRKAVATCDFYKSDTAFLKICNNIFNTIRVLK